MCVGVMADLLRLDNENTDIWLTYSWSNNNHGICGHTYEVIDYYLLLKDFFKVGILLAEDIDWPLFKKAITAKYDLTETELAIIEKRTVFSNRPKLVHCSNILFTDGGIRSLQGKTILAHKIIHFACGDDELQDHENENVYVLQDRRIYKDCLNGLDYKKKINFSRYKEQNKGRDQILLYGTKNCRHIPDQVFHELLDQYDGEFICLTNQENRPSWFLPRMKFLEMPVDDLFEKFQTYIYTPVPRKFDCSPRLIAECEFYGKKVIYHGINYWEEDKGLYWRKWDIDNNFESLSLDREDAIIDILRDVCEL